MLVNVRFSSFESMQIAGAQRCQIKAPKWPMGVLNSQMRALGRVFREWKSLTSRSARAATGQRSFRY